MLSRLIGIAVDRLHESRKFGEDLVTRIDNVLLALVRGDLGGLCAFGGLCALDTAHDVGRSRAVAADEGTAAAAVTGLGAAETVAPGGLAFEFQTALWELVTTTDCNRVDLGIRTFTSAGSLGHRLL